MEPARAAESPEARALPPGPRTIGVLALFMAFAEISLSSFGGAIAWARHVLVDRRQWLSEREFAELFGLCQAVPGPSIVNLAIYLGTQHRGLAGAVAAATGFIVPPLAVLLPLGIVYSQAAHLAVVQAALQGVAAAAAGLLLATGIKMAQPYRREPRALLVAGLALLAVGGLHWPLVLVVLGLAPWSILLAWRRFA